MTESGDGSGSEEGLAAVAVVVILPAQTDDAERRVGGGRVRTGTGGTRGKVLDVDTQGAA